MKQTEGPGLDEREYWEALIKKSVSRYFLLCMLHERPMHGYDIAKNIELCCEGWCRPTDGMIYPTLKELLSEGYLECETEVVGGRSRKVCRLTSRGRLALETATGVWAQVLPFLQECATRTVSGVSRETVGTHDCDGPGCSGCRMDIPAAAC